MDRFTMREAGECHVFDDDRIWHMLTPVAVPEGNQFAYRDTLVRYAARGLGTREVIRSCSIPRGVSALRNAPYARNCARP
jgi:hypothetical protein